MLLSVLENPTTTSLLVPGQWASGVRRKEEAGWGAFVCSLQPHRILRPMNTVSSPSAGNDRGLDAMGNLGAVNISVSKVTGG